MGTMAPQEYPETGALSEEGGARPAIIGAARRVAQRDGMSAMTLAAVAKEASIAATDIYAFFTSKNDLLRAVVGDDLAALARSMRRNFDHPSAAASPVPSAANAISVALAGRAPDGGATVTGNSQPQDTQVSPMETAESVQNEEQNAPEAVSAALAQDVPRRFPLVQARREPSPSGAVDPNATTAEGIARLSDAVARLEAYPVDQWLERRLREFERTLYALQHNQNHRASGNTIEHGLRSLRESLEALDMRHTMAADESTRAAAERFDSLDRRLRQILSELQAESTHLARRITALENLAFASRPEQLPPPVAAFAPVEEPEPAVAQAQATSETGDGAAHEGPAGDSDAPMPSYLTAARRSAQAAAEHAGEDLRQRAIAPEPKKTLLYVACGALALFVVLLAGAGFLLRDSSMKTRDIRVAVKAAPVRIVRAIPKPLQHVAQKAPQTNLLALAQAGDASAELLVGLQYLEGRGVAKNEAMAVDWLSRAAAKGQPVAQYDLGALYADGRGVPADAVQAFQWFGSAALHGNRRAMHFLAIAYAEGLGTTKDLPEAARWFERAAMLGAVNSQFNLAVLYERGMGVPQSLTTAYKWYAIAARQGDHESQARVAALASTLKSDDLASAKAAADAFKPEPLDSFANLPPKLPS